jgi:predicted nucleic acid-binding protein
LIIVDSSVWIDHFRRGVDAVGALASRADVLMHPFVLTEIALGSLPDRRMTLRFLRRLVVTKVATQDDVDVLVEEHRLYGSGLDFVDVHLLASARLSGDAQLWSRDHRLHSAAEVLGVAYTEV